MSTDTNKRDYRLTGPESKIALEKGLVAAEWYISLVPRKRLKELMKRRNGPAIRDTILWFCALAGTGFLACWTWGTWWAIPAFALYGIVYSSPADSRWHECGHGTAFKTPWMNEVVYQIASFMSLRPATPWRWSHTRHHTDTIIVGRDPEIVAPRPPVWRIILMDFFRLYGGPKDIRRMIMHCFGKLDEEEREYIPRSEFSKACWESRVYVLLFIGIISWCIVTKSFLPAMLIGLPSFYGAFLVLVFGMTQHLGLNEDVLDHRLNTRTIYMNPIFRFLYWNMNYHIEHHMFPMIPYHALPALHEEMKDDCPPPCRSLWSAIKEVVTALVRQGKDPTYTIERTLPATARPYGFGNDDKTTGGVTYAGS
ncbi:fatty acid desaturase family protein [Cohnella silvisoli]|uniref:Fatty acid desaturase family protein n=1 Tax=Cohnella silvisoli TaxID=2873699 RepID=A0ABV1KXW0_9BACL|nr:fatty acid desaturase family protein [Cohnella silvisoli]MCD9023730.1 fatty acid desaturase family protein [Cohnella silvisoli]